MGTSSRGLPAFRALDWRGDACPASGVLASGTFVGVDRGSVRERADRRCRGDDRDASPASLARAARGGGDGGVGGGGWADLACQQRFGEPLEQVPDLRTHDGFPPWITRLAALVGIDQLVVTEPGLVDENEDPRAT